MRIVTLPLGKLFRALSTGEASRTGAAAAKVEKAPKTRRAMLNFTMMKI
jgi:hypothetical protein